MKTNSSPMLKESKAELNDELLLAKCVERRLANPDGRGILAEDIPKLLKRWIRDAQKTNRARK
jgi:hypothetical protein